eukprot:m.465836 g.465836  ORF g.465836 m.465836 type:complete len:650 (+) comp57053_c0_seq2:254-2203(+)
MSTESTTAPMTQELSELATPSVTKQASFIYDPLLAACQSELSLSATNDDSSAEEFVRTISCEETLGQLMESHPSVEQRQAEQTTESAADPGGTQPVSTMASSEERVMPLTMPPEPQEGNTEYKLKLVNPTADRLVHLATQMKWRLAEGEGEAVYEIGVADDGEMTGLSQSDMDASLQTLRTIAASVGAHVTILRTRDPVAGFGCVAEVHVRRVPDDQQFIDLRVAMLGSADAGKSTLLGVLTTGELDNGRGRARLNLFRHRHEIESGHTSSIGSEILGFDSQGQVVNYHVSYGVCTREEICERSSKIVTFVDLAGHERYLRTTVFGLTSRPPDYATLVVSAVAGLCGTALEHFGLAHELQLSVFIVITQIDICNRATLLRTLEEITSLLKSPKYKKVPSIVGCLDDVMLLAPQAQDSSVVPIFMLSSVSGKNLNLLKAFLNLLPPKSNSDQLATQPIDFVIEETFDVAGTGVVVGGMLKQGSVQVGDRLLLGPDANGAFNPVTIRTIHRNRVPYRFLKAGQAASFCLDGIQSHDVRLGQAIVASELRPKACWEFKAELFVTQHPTKIAANFQGLAHIGNVRQTVSILHIDPEAVAKGEKGLAVLRFQRQPEFIRVGASILIRSAHGKCIGHIVSINPIDAPGATQQSTP